MHPMTGEKTLSYRIRHTEHFRPLEVRLKPSDSLRKSFGLRKSSLGGTVKNTSLFSAGKGGVREARVCDGLSVSLSPAIWPEHSGCKATGIYNISHGSLQHNAVTKPPTYLKCTHTHLNMHKNLNAPANTNTRSSFPPFPSLIKYKRTLKPKFLDSIQGYLQCV